MPKLEPQTRSRRSGEPPPPRSCDCPGCAAVGDFPAPKARDRLREYFWFCLDHVREYNRAWDFYAGMSMAEIESEMRSDTTWQRPTWPLGSWRLMDPHLAERVHSEEGFPFGRTGGEGPDGAEASRARQSARTPEDEALRVLDLDRNATFVEIKVRYRELAKAHHPDANGGDKVAEERLKRINQAYTTLKGSFGR